jgi:hypothetical protein
MMLSLPVHQSDGHMLLHKITRIIPGLSTGPIFQIRHIIRERHLHMLLDMGKEEAE